MKFLGQCLTPELSGAGLALGSTGMVFESDSVDVSSLKAESIVATR